MFGTAGITIADFVYKVVKSGVIPYAFMHMAGKNNGKITKRSEDFEIFSKETDGKGISF
jgi:hypothetical protein